MTPPQLPAMPAPVVRFFSADTDNPQAVANCFSDNAVVTDEHRQHHGRHAIAE